MTKPYVRLDKNNAAVLLVDHQAGLLSLVRDIEPDKFKNNVLALADLATEDRNGDHTMPIRRPDVVGRERLCRAGQRVAGVLVLVVRPACLGGEESAPIPASDASSGPTSASSTARTLRRPAASFVMSRSSAGSSGSASPRRRARPTRVGSSAASICWPPNMGSIRTTPICCARSAPISGSARSSTCPTGWCRSTFQRWYSTDA